MELPPLTKEAFVAMQTLEGEGGRLPGVPGRSGEAVPLGILVVDLKSIKKYRGWFVLDGAHPVGLS